MAGTPALAGMQVGFFSAQLGQVSLDPVVYATNAAEAQALENGQLDAAYLDPVTAVAVWQSAGGRAIKVMAGAAWGGAELVARNGITSAQQLTHAAVAAPAGGAQQAALEYWLKQHKIPGTSPGDVTMTAVYLAGALKSGRLAAAWEPAPLDAQMAAAGGHVLVDEASLWPGGQFPTSVLVVTARFLAGHAAAVRLLLRAHIQAEEFLGTSPASARAAYGRKLAAITGTALPPAVLAQAFAQMKFTSDPLPSGVLAEAQHAAAAGLLEPVTSLAGLFDLGPLNVLLKASGQRQVGT